jgi:hypothetical protein
MPTQITLNLPDSVYRHAASLALMTNQDVAGVLAETITSSLSPLGSDALASQPLTELSDRDVLAAADAYLPAAQGARLNSLLDQQQQGTLTEPLRGELAALMQVYHEALIRKAFALREAVRRGLRPPLTS